VYWKCLISKAASPELKPACWNLEKREDLRMTLELVLAAAAIISCIATVASAVITALSYLKNKKS